MLRFSFSLGDIHKTISNILFIFLYCLTINIFQFELGNLAEKDILKFRWKIYQYLRRNKLFRIIVTTPIFTYYDKYFNLFLKTNFICSLRYLLQIQNSLEKVKT